MTIPTPPDNCFIRTCGCWSWDIPGEGTRYKFCQSCTDEIERKRHRVAERLTMRENVFWHVVWQGRTILVRKKTDYGVNLAHFLGSYSKKRGLAEWVVTLTNALGKEVTVTTVYTLPAAKDLLETHAHKMAELCDSTDTARIAHLQNIAETRHRSKFLPTRPMGIINKWLR